MDEKSLILITIGIPVLLIGAVEAVPLALTYGESTVIPKLGEMFTLNSGKVALANGSTEFGEQYFTRIMIENDYNPLNVDWFDVGGSATLSKPGAMILNSSFDYNGNGEFEINSIEQTSRNLFNRKAKYYISSKFGQSISGPVKSLSEPTGQFLDKSMNMIFRVAINKTTDPKESERKEKK